ncbi:MAG: pyridoxal kinase [Devosia sp.]
MNVISIQSEVIYGHVGNAAARFALQRLGHEVWGVPTVLLTSHAAHPGVTGEATSPALLGKLFAGLEAQGRLREADAIVSGYLGSPEQAALVAALVSRAKAANPKLLYCLDPAFGDDGRIYARPGVAEAMGKTLLPLADLVTPNAFELSVLAGRPVADAESAALAADLLQRPLVVAKSVPVEGRIGTLTTINGHVWVAATPIVPHAPRGAGDLFAALFFGRYLKGALTAEALDLATRAVYHVLAQSDGEPEMRLIAEQEALVKPPQPAGYSFGPIETGARAHG